MLEAELQQHRNNMALGYTAGVGAAARAGRVARRVARRAAVRRRCLLPSPAPCRAAGAPCSQRVDVLLIHTDTQGAFTKASSVQLRNTMRTSESEEVRKAAYEGLRSVGPHVAGASCAGQPVQGRR